MKQNENEKTKKKRKREKDSPNNQFDDDSSKIVFGDETRDRIGDFLRLADSVSRVFDSRYLSFAERRQYALIGIAHGLESFQAGRSSEGTWLRLKALYTVKNAIRQERRRRHKDPTAKSIPFERELVAHDSDSEEHSRRAKLLQKALARLDARTRNIVVAVNYQGKTQKEAAEEYGISQSWASRLYKCGLKKMRNYILSQGGVDF